MLCHRGAAYISISWIYYLSRFETREFHNSILTETVLVNLFTKVLLKSIQSPLEPWSSNLIGERTFWPRERSVSDLQ